MNKILTIRNKLLSLRGQMDINDEYDQGLYTARGELSFFFSPTWRITNSHSEIATLKRRRFSLRPTYDVTSQFGNYTVKKKWLSWSRHYTVSGGMFDGATATGNFLDLEFSIKHGNREIASVSERLVSLRDTHVIIVNKDESPDVLFTCVLMVIMQLDKRDGNGSVVGSD